MDDENKVIGKVWIIETSFGPDPKIYLNKPLFLLHKDESVKEFDNVFDAKKYINFVFPGLRPEIVRRKEYLAG